MTCEEMISTLDDYVGERMPEGQRQAAQRHLAACQSCVAYTESYRRTIELEKSLTSDDLRARMPEDLARRIAGRREG